MGLRSVIEAIVIAPLAYGLGGALGEGRLSPKRGRGFSPATAPSRSRVQSLVLPLIVVHAALALVLGGCGEQAESRARTAKRAPKAHLVELARVELDSLRTTNVFTGSLRHRQSVRIFNQEEGRVVGLSHFEGDPVTQGETVLELDDALLGAQLEKARAVRREAGANVARLERLRERRLVSEDEYLRAVTALEVAKAEQSVLATRMSYTRVQAPFSGVVTARLVEPGDIVERHTHVLTIVDPGSLITELSVSEMLLPHIAIGDRVGVRIDALGDREFPGRVSRIHPELDPRTRQGTVEVELDPVPQGARAGQFARVSFTTEALERKIIPFAAVRRDREGEYVYRLDETSTAHRTPVRSGRRMADRVEVLEGLQPGDAVVVKGFLGLSDGTHVQPVNADPDGGSASLRSARPAPRGG